VTLNMAGHFGDICLRRGAVPNRCSLAVSSTLYLLAIATRCTAACGKQRTTPASGLRSLMRHLSSHSTSGAGADGRRLPYRAPSLYRATAWPLTAPAHQYRLLPASAGFFARDITDIFDRAHYLRTRPAQRRQPIPHLRATGPRRGNTSGVSCSASASHRTSKQRGTSPPTPFLTTPSPAPPIHHTSALPTTRQPVCRLHTALNWRTARHCHAWA